MSSTLEFHFRHMSHYEVQSLLKSTGPVVHLQLIQEVHLGNEELSYIGMPNGTSPRLSYDQSHGYKFDIYDTFSSHFSSSSTARVYNQYHQLHHHSNGYGMLILFTALSASMSLNKFIHFDSIVPYWPLYF